MTSVRSFPLITRIAALVSAAACLVIVLLTPTAQGFFPMFTGAWRLVPIAFVWGIALLAIGGGATVPFTTTVIGADELSLKVGGLTVQRVAWNEISSAWIQSMDVLTCGAESLVHVECVDGRARRFPVPRKVVADVQERLKPVLNGKAVDAQDIDRNDEENESNRRG